MELVALAIVSLVSSVRLADGEEQVLVTTQGELRGIVSEDGNYVSFYGVPYAGTPMGQYRFKSAPPPTLWDGLRDARHPAAGCVAYGAHSQLTGSEDCLLLHVHAPASRQGPLPILVWVHGGGFTTGTGAAYGPSYLIPHGIIIVTLDYRLGPLGFLCPNAAGIAGNAGLKDIVAALRWVRDNIIAFSGNPASVTIFGQSTGAAAVELLMLSKMAKRLFHRAILSSGSSLTPWAFNYDAETRFKTLQSRLDNGADNSAEIFNVLQEMNAYDLTHLSRELNSLYFPFGPCIEKPIENEEQFLDGSPLNILSSREDGGVDVIIGYNNNEAYIMAQSLSKFESLNTLNKTFDKLIPKVLQFQTLDEKELISSQLKSLYFSGDVTIKQILNYQTDAMFLNFIYRSVRLQAANPANNIYFYEFSYKGGLNFEGPIDIMNDGASHSDDLAYIFTNINRNNEISKPNDNDKLTIDRITTMWTNFAKYGDPTPQVSSLLPVKWLPVDNDDIQLLKIDKSIAMAPFDKIDKMTVWQDIYDKYYFEYYSEKNDGLNEAN